MALGFLLDRLRVHGAREAVVWREESFSHGWLAERVTHWRSWLAASGIEPGAVVALEAEFSPNAIAMLLALVDHGAVVVPLTASVEAHKPEFLAVSEAEHLIRVDGHDAAARASTGAVARHPLLLELRRRGHPGLVLFSSGSTGRSKAALHDFVPLLRKFEQPRRGLRTLSFLLFDHIGGVNTLLACLSSGGCLITCADRSADAVAEAISRHRVQLLPTSPSFINLLLLSEAPQRHDLGSLELVTYGTEVMPESTLRRLRAALPRARLQQTYGLSEVGILRSKSRADDSLWVRIGGEDFQTRVVDGLLEIQAASAMLGYLNHPSPFTEDGWFRTGDAVEVDGEYLRILGRRSEIINVGGEKVYPAEVESVLQQMDHVEDVAVVGEPHAILGHIVRARVKLASGESASAFRQRMHAFCRDRLARFKIPQKVELVAGDLHGARFKKMR